MVDLSGLAVGDAKLAVQKGPFRLSLARFCDHFDGARQACLVTSRNQRAPQKQLDLRAVRPQSNGVLIGCCGG